jgi:hypothetical protein
MAALSIGKSKTPLGDYCRRIRTRAGVPKAVIAAAQKLPVIYYNMLSPKTAFEPKALEEYQQTYKEKNDYPQNYP